MSWARKRGRRAARAALSCALLALALSPSARAAGPILGPAWATDVSATSARLHATITPAGIPATYHLDYITQAAYEANLAAAKEPFSGAQKAPAGTDASAGSGTSPVNVAQLLANLKADTAYRYRVVAKDGSGTEAGAAHSLQTFSLGGPLLADGRGWELVSPVDKNGGQVDPPESIAAGGLLQAAAQGDSITYSSATSFGQGAQGAPPASQYLATRSAGGWSTENLTVPILSGSYDAEGGGVPYRLFSADLARALLLNGDRCRGGGTGCPVANPPLPGSGAPAGYQDYYLRTNAPGAFQALLSSTDLAAQDPARFGVSLAGATSDLSQVVLSSCAALTPNAIEVPLGEGCDPGAQNLYEWSAGAGLALLNLLPAQSSGTPGAELAAPSGAISGDGSRVYFTQGENLYLREGNTTKQVDAAAGGGGTLQTASTNGSVAYFLKAEHLWRYSGGAATDLTPSGGVARVLGGSEDGAHLYFQDASALKLWHEGSTGVVAPGADASQPTDSPPETGGARVSADGAQLLFSSQAPLTGYDNTDQGTGLPDAQLYLYDALADSLTCVSCNPTNARPLGPSSVPGAIANGAGDRASFYRPRALSADGRRVFFDSEDSLAPPDTNSDPDVYEWEATGKGSCGKAGGCISLISSGKAEEGASFVDASADGSDAFFLTVGSLVSADPGSLDLYDARVGGGFPEPSPPIPCEGDACQVLPSEPVDPTLTTLLSGLGNPPVRYAQRNRVPHKKRHKKKHHHKGKGQRQGGRR
jgi:hypothetical protein